MKKTVFNGCDLINTEKVKKLLSGKKIGLVTNDSAKTKENTPVSVALSSNFCVKALFSAEHGLNISKQAGEFDCEYFIDLKTNIPVYNLFGDDAVLNNAEKIFETLDLIVFDMQDIGTRYYTYQYTLLDTMWLCKRANKQLIVLDRINPLGCKRVEGSCLDYDCISEVGRVPLQPVISGMTMGELSLWYNEALSIDTDITVIKCSGLTRDILFEDTDLLFTPPSPNIKSLDALFLYAGTCLFEGMNISEGRGTDLPFEVFGAPWLDPEAVIKALNNYPDEIKEYWNGLNFIPFSFTPSFSDYKDEFCNGIKLIIRNKNEVKPFETGLYIIEALTKLYKDKLVKDKHLASLVGSNAVLDEDFDATLFLKSQKSEIDNFLMQRKEFLLYE